MIAFRTNESKYQFQGSPKLINAYAEALGQDAKAQIGVMPCAGMVTFSSVTDTPCRGMIALDDLDCIYTVHSQAVYKVVSSGTATRIGTLPGIDDVQMSRNQAADPQISIHCGAGEFYIENDLVKNVLDEDLPEAVSQDHAGGYTCYGIEDRRVFISGINQCQFVGAEDYATAEGSADPLVRVKEDGGDLYVFKKRSIEPWRNTGQADFPFEPIGGAGIKKGLLAANAVAACDNSLMFPGDDAVVYRIQGTGGLQRISNHGVERTIKADDSQSAMLGFSHFDEGHSFYTLAGSNFTRVYDAATKEWHSRESYGMNRWRARFAVRMWNKTIVGDTLSGKLFYLASDTFTEDGTAMIWGVDSPVIHAFPNGGIVHAVHIDVATGYGALLSTAQGHDPELMFSWSTDGGHSFRMERLLKIGKRGERVRVTTRNLGRFGPKGLVLRLRISDPVVRSIINIEPEIRAVKR